MMDRQFDPSQTSLFPALPCPFLPFPSLSCTFLYFLALSFREDTHKNVFLVVGPLRFHPPYINGLVVHATFFFYSYNSLKRILTIFSFLLNFWAKSDTCPFLPFPALSCSYLYFRLLSANFLHFPGLGSDSQNKTKTTEQKNWTNGSRIL